MLSDNFPEPTSFTATFFNFWLALTIISFAHVLVYMIHKKGSQTTSKSSQMPNNSLQTFPMSPRDTRKGIAVDSDQKDNVLPHSDKQQIPSPESSGNSLNCTMLCCNNTNQITNLYLAEKTMKNDKISRVV
jgi:hypothetical protein